MLDLLQRRFLSNLEQFCRKKNRKAKEQGWELSFTLWEPCWLFSVASSSFLMYTASAATRLLQKPSELDNGTSQLRVNVNMLIFFSKSISQPRPPHHSNWLGTEGDKIHNIPRKFGFNLLGVWCHGAWVFQALGTPSPCCPWNSSLWSKLSRSQVPGRKHCYLYLQSALMQKNPIISTHYSQSCWGFYAFYCACT